MRYPIEVLDEDYDDGTMQANVDELAEHVIGHRIVKVEKLPPEKNSWDGDRLAITLDTGKTVFLADTNDCCALTELGSFILNADKIDHIITGVGTTDEFNTWHIYADMGDVLTMSVGWSAGNPFYYGYGFSIKVTE